jgi:hypothetical protein
MTLKNIVHSDIVLNNSFAIFLLELVYKWICKGQL